MGIYDFSAYQEIFVGDVDTSSSTNAHQMNQALSEFVTNFRRSHQAVTFPYGGYLEKRTIYSFSDHFDIQVRDIHLGIDIWAEAGVPIYASMDGIVHSVKYNEAELDYGHCLIIDYRAFGHALYGHLGTCKLTPGDHVLKGQPIGIIGDKGENGGWYPHLHLQKIHDMQGMLGDYPGVCNQDDIDFYEKNCPNPLDLVFGAKA